MADVNKEMIISLNVMDNLVDARKRMNEMNISIKDLRLSLGTLIKEYDRLSDQEKKGIIVTSERAKKELVLKSSINATRSVLRDNYIELAKSSAEYKKCQKSIDDCAKAEDFLNIMSSKTSFAIEELKGQLTALKNISLTGVTEQSIIKIKEAISTVELSIEKLELKSKSEGFSNFLKNISEGLDVLSASLNITTNVFKQFGVDTNILEEFSAKILEAKATVEALSAVTEYLTAKKYKLLAANIANIAIKIKNAIVTKAEAVAYTILGRSVDATSMSLRILKMALISTGIGAIIVGVGMLIELMIGLASSTKEASRVQTMYNNAVNSASESVSGQIASLKSLQEKWNSLGDDLKSKKRFIEENRDKFRELGVEINDIKDAENLLVANSDAFVKGLQKRALAAAYMKESAKYYEEAVKNMINADNIPTTESDLFKGYRQVLKNTADQNIAFADQIVKKSIEVGDEANAIMKNAGIRDVKQNGRQNTSGSDKDDQKKQQEEKALLEQQLKETLALLSKSVDEQIAEVQNKYAKARETIKNDPTLSKKDKAVYDAKLKAEEEKEIQKTRKAFYDQQAADLRTSYEDQLAAASNNAKKQLELTIEMQKKIIEAKKEAKLNTADEEAKLKQLEMQQQDLLLEEKLISEANNEKQIFDLKQAALDKKMALLDIESIEYKKLAAEKKKNEEEYTAYQQQQQQQQIQNVIDTASKIKDAFGSAFGVMKDLEDAQLQREEQNAETKKEQLQAQLDSGAISQEEHAQKVAEIDQNLDKKKAEIARKQAAREKIMKVFEIGMNTATAIMRIWSDVPKYDFGISTGILTGIAAAMGAAQLAAVMATPLPKAAKGGRIVGPSHAQGGVLIEAEGGEYIINKRNSALFGGLLSMLNDGNIGRYNTPFGDGGYAYRTSMQQSMPASNPDLIASAVANGIQKANIFVAVEDINTMNRKIEVVDLDNKEF